MRPSTVFLYWISIVVMSTLAELPTVMLMGTLPEGTSVSVR